MILTSTTTLINESLKTAFSTAVNQITADVSSMMALALPAGLLIMGGFLAIGLGIKFFKNVAH